MSDPLEGATLLEKRDPMLALFRQEPDRPARPGAGWAGRRAFALLEALRARSWLRSSVSPAAGTQADPSESEQALAERHRPLLVLYPEISSESRRTRPDWRQSGKAPLYEDYHPRDVKLILDHARIPGRPSLHDGNRLVDELERDPKAARIDLLQGIGHADRKKF